MLIANRRYSEDAAHCGGRSDARVQTAAKSREAALLFNLEESLPPSSAHLTSMPEWCRLLRRIASTRPSAQVISVRQRGLREYERRIAAGAKGGQSWTSIRPLLPPRVLDVATILLAIAVAVWGSLLCSRLHSEMDRGVRSPLSVLRLFLPFTFPLVGLAFVLSTSISIYHLP